MPTIIDRRSEIGPRRTVNFPSPSLGEGGRRPSFGSEAVSLIAQSRRGEGTRESISNALKQRDSELLVCDVSLYFQLYNEVLQKTGGNHDLAKKYTYLAAKKDGGALIQENISALSLNGTPIFDLESRARMQMTPTVNTYLLYREEKYNDQTGEKELNQKMVSPEHALIGRSVTEALTGWRRDNDRAAMAQNERLFIDKDKKFNPTKTRTLIWGSPIAAKGEGEIIEKYNGEYGYLYVGTITEEAGVRKMILHSYKNDLSPEDYMKFLSGINGQEAFAGFSDQTTSQTRAVDRVMRTSVMIEGELTPREVYKRLFDIKKEQGITTMFGIDYNTLMTVQDPELRQRLEDEASAEVASWLVDQMGQGVDPKTLQGQIKDKYIQATGKTLRKIKNERALLGTVKMDKLGNPIVNEESVDPALLASMKTNTGAFCGTWETGSSAKGLTGSLGNYTTFSSKGWGGESRGGSKETVHCDNCNKNRTKEELGSCGLCLVCFPE